MLYPARLANPDAASIRTDCKNLSVCQHALRRVAPSRCVVRNADPVERESAVHSPGNEPESTASRPADSGDAVTYSYHSDGHYKATLEDVFKKSSNATLVSDHAPWSMGWQTNERNIMWNDDLKLRLIKAYLHLACSRMPFSRVLLAIRSCAMDTIRESV